MSEQNGSGRGTSAGTSRSSAIRRVGIVGSGTMGRGIAHAAAAGGLQVTLLDTSSAALESALAQLGKEYDYLASKNTLSADDRAAREGALSTTTELGDLSGCDLIIEAVPEILDLKLRVLGDIAGVASAGTIIASNTSSIPITRLASAVADPSRFLGVHFFNPVPRMPLVEVIRTVLTDAEAEAGITAFVKEQLGKEPVAIDDRPGFVVNALLVPYLLAAIRMLDSGYATAEQIDTGMKLGAGHPMGPITLSDFIGLDIMVDVADAIHSETHDPALVVPNNLRRLVEAGRLGRKSGQGFYTY
jgi:3-hydroxybutyryl-CoA dehydrogenase